jgi:RHS repeat-associated protein
MSMHQLISRFTFKSTIKAIAACIILFVSFAQAFAQSSTDGQTPLGLTRGAPTGSYPLSDFETVNLFNGNLNFQMPLLTIGGRGGTSFPLTLHIDQKWTISKEVNPGHAAYHFGHSTWWSEDDGGNHTISAGRVRIRRGLLKNSGGVLKTLTRITFTAPDGTEYELRDLATGGQPQVVGASAYNRQKIFVTADGSAATFSSDSDVIDGYGYDDDTIEYPANGYLLLKDGTRFRIDEDKVSSMRDRNGNKVSFGNDNFKRVTSVTDSLNRQVTITYDNVSGGETFDQISYKGFGGASRTVKVGHIGVGSAIRSDITASYPLFSGLTGVDNSNPPVVSFIELPDGRRYQLKYNAYAEIARIVLPTGGAIEYDWANGLTDGAASGLVQAAAPNEWYVYRRVIERRIYPDGSTGTSFASKMTYSRPETTSGNAGYVQVDQYDSSSTLLGRSIHYFYGSARDSFAQKPTDYSAWQDGKEYKTETYDSNGSTLLRKIENSFEQRAAVSWWTGGSTTAPPNDVRSTEAITTLSDTNQVSKQTFGYDDSVPFNNQNNVKEYDFGSGSPGALIRETSTTYLTSSTYTGTTVHIRNLPLQVSVYNGSSGEKARTTFEYDNYTLDGSDCQHSFHCSLTGRSSVSGFDSSFGTSYTTRGNRTATTQYLLVNGSVTGSISAYSQYDVLGNVLRSIDPRSTTSNIIATTFEYDDRFGAPNGNAQTPTTPSELSGLSSFAYPTKVTNAAGHISYTQLDYYLGKPVDGEDANGIVASGFYNDPLDRPKKVQRAVGTPLQNQTTFDYDDTSRVITTATDRDTNTDGVIVSELRYDQMGRTTETRQYEGGSNYIVVKTHYDDLGRADMTSNPYRPWQSEVAIWTVQEFDALGRVIKVTTPDSAKVATSYPGNSVEVTDQAGKKRRSVSDALGRLVQVYEDPGTSGSLNYLTSYSYDTLDDLTTVTQGSQTRTFVYDSLKRLSSATNPESGTVSYVYDNGGNLTQKTDARGVVSTYAYDVLSRNTSVSYSNDPSGTLPVTHIYDTATNGKGRFYQSQTTGTGGSLSTTDAYDELGRPTNLRQQFYVSGTWSGSYTTSRSYNLAGGVTSQTYPSGYTVNYGFDVAGRTTEFTGNLGGASRNYATEILYSSLGAITKEKFGTTTAVYNKLFYNSRGQLAEIRDSTSWTGLTDTTWDRGAIINHYSDNCWGMCGGSNSTTAMTDNNGNLKKQEVYIPNEDQSGYTQRWQQYEYDQLNRLTSAREIYNNTEQWKQGFTYDRYGNRTIDLGITYGGVNNRAFTVDTNTNRLGVPSGQTGTMTYDAAGNLTTDSYSSYGQGTYNADNRMVAAQDSYAGWSYYTYNADGQRVRRKINNAETWAIYGMDGEMVAEYAASGAGNSPQKEYGYRNGQLLITADCSARTNFALSSNGSTASASSTYTAYPFSPGAAIDGEHKGLNFLSGGGWHSSTTAMPQWLQVDFNGSKTLNEVDVFSVQDDYANPVEPTEAMTFSVYGLTAFDVQYWTGTTWATVPGGTITGNNKVWKKVSFSAITTTKIRVVINASVDSWSRILEVEAWGLPLPPSNVASASNGAMASASSIYSPGQGASYSALPADAINGDRAGKVGSVTSWWNDGTQGAGPDWLQVDFSGSKTISEIDLFTTQDSYTNPSEPTEAMTFSTLGLTSYELQYWNGSTWVGVPGGSVSGNNKVWRKFTFLAITTTKIRVLTNASPDGWSRIVELEAWTPAESSSGVHWLVADQLGTPRMIFDQSGILANVKRHDYLPFGEEIVGVESGRSTTNGYGGGDGVRQRFTQKERDIETGLDYFGARYYGPTTGRFSSVDPITVSSQRLIDPQQLNLYSYARNNPLAFVDDDGKQTKKAESNKPVVTIHKPTVNRTTYDVSGTTAKEAISNATKHDGFAGNTHFENSSTWKSDVTWSRQRNGAVVATATVASVDVKTTITVDTPNWVDSAKAPEIEQESWNQYSKGLDDHEQGHVAIDIAGAADVGNAIAETPESQATGRTPVEAMRKATTGLDAEAARRGRAAVQNVRDKNNKYDEDTDHGRKKN